MKRGPIVVTVSLALVMGLALAPTAALAERFRGGAVGSRVFVGSRPFVSHPFVHHPFFPRPFVARPLFRPFIPFGVIASPVVVYAPPPVYYGAPAYYAPSAYYDAPAVYSPPAGGTVSVAPSPMPNVVQYPHGRYELRGDGVTTPYTWVWIPNPPPPPPPPAAPSPAAPAQQTPPASQSGVYCWTDEQGVTTWTDQWDKIPVRYRAQARRPNLSGARPL